MHPVTHGKTKNRFCGPAAISIITGIDTGTAAALMRLKTGRRQITGASHWELEKVLQSLGFFTTSVFDCPLVKKRPTLASWLKTSVADRTAGKMFLVSAGHHWQVVSGRRYCCGITGEIVSVRSDRVKRRARVRAVYEVVRADASISPKREAVKLLAPVAKSRSSDYAKAGRARQLAKDHGIELDFDGLTVADGVWVYGPAGTPEDSDPYAGERYCTDWEDVLERVEGYIALMAENPQYFAQGQRLAA